MNTIRKNPVRTALINISTTLSFCSQNSHCCCFFILRKESNMAKSRHFLSDEELNQEIENLLNEINNERRGITEEIEDEGKYFKWII